MPESNVGVARQYAEAAFELAVERNSVDRWLEELRAVAAALSEPGVRAVLDSPSVGEQLKFTVVRRSLATVDPLLVNLVLLLLRRRRLGYLRLIASEFARMVDERRGVVLAEVTTAVPLDEQHREAVRRRLASVLGKTVRLRESVDPGIIGGLVVQVGDKLINGSIAGRLASLRRELA